MVPSSLTRNTRHGSVAWTFSISGLSGRSSNRPAPMLMCVTIEQVPTPRGPSSKASLGSLSISSSQSYACWLKVLQMPSALTLGRLMFAPSPGTSCDQ